MNSKEVGNCGELIAAQKCIQHGYSVSFPYGNSSHYDMLIDNGKKISRIQVKTVTPKKKILLAGLFRSCYSKELGKNNRSKRVRYTEDEIDAFIVVNSETSDCYWIEIDDSRITPSGNIIINIDNDLKF